MIDITIAVRSSRLHAPRRAAPRSRATGRHRTRLQKETRTRVPSWSFSFRSPGSLGHRRACPTNRQLQTFFLRSSYVRTYRTRAFLPGPRSTASSNSAQKQEERYARHISRQIYFTVTDVSARMKLATGRVNPFLRRVWHVRYCSPI